MTAAAAVTLSPTLTVTDGRRSGVPRRFARTDLGNAERFVARFGQDVHYLPAWKKWLLWDGRRWAIDETLAVVRMAKETVRAIYVEAGNESTAEARKELTVHAVKSEADGRIRAMLGLVQSEPGIAITPAALDTNPWLLSALNGTIDLRTGKLRPHERDDLILSV